MMKSGYRINKLRIIGESVDKAEIIFHPGVNVITGPSQTGKTYVFQCINYMLGSSKPPKKIKESRAYSSIYLEIADCQNIFYTLKSDLKGGDLQLYDGPIDELTFNQEFKPLKRKHSPKDSSTVSAFLLSLNNAYGKKIRTNAKGKIREISYRDIIRYLMINEERIITEDSLITSHYTKATPESNVLKFIISGSDDSDVVASLSKTEITNKKGRLELLNELIIEMGTDINQLKEEKEKDSLETIVTKIEALNKEYQTLNVRYEVLASERREILLIEEKQNRRKRIIEELYQRSNLLKRHYEVDIKRLKSTIEASVLLLDDHDESTLCPLCKRKLEHECDNTDLNKVIASCSAEISKIEGLLIELLESEKVILEELAELVIIINDLKERKSTILQEIDEKVGVNMKTLLNDIGVLNEKKSYFLGINIKQDQLKKYVAQKEKIEQIIKQARTQNEFESLTTANMTKLSNQMELVLEGCNYPNLSAVSFSEDNKDFVISGEDRALFGKGYRAIIYAAFIVSIQELLFDRNYSIGVPVLDSPFVTYKKADENENDQIPIDLAMDFYRYIVSGKHIDQIIIIENVEPPTDTFNYLNHIKFTRSHKVGRYGFIPINNDKN